MQYKLSAYKLEMLFEIIIDMSHEFINTSIGVYDSGEFKIVFNQCDGKID